ncbi:MAG: alpha-ketoglutarate-dependent dioxygenase AlkB [Gordonia sp. (in: high G+C Gram-positive bacteria)]|uniref:alpha-ketoglutarate-dependent dioxygenase AlkB n=1 Tax=Gordonia sp. (in: high G+C Gram-positive bacteria) TaxID=84139 RepID=UPI0039E4DDC3
MVIGIQESLFADPTATETGVRSLTSGMSRTVLPYGAWVDVRPGWLTGASSLFDRLSAVVPWRTEQVTMYDSVVDVPRLMRYYDADERLPDPLLEDLRDALSVRYRETLPEGFRTAGLCLYRDGDDSVAWHGDRIGRGEHSDTLVAIVSLGAPRVLALRPRGGGQSIRFTLGSGDLLVMGGSCQRTWDHAVPKMRAAGPRISIQFRPAGVR